MRTWVVRHACAGHKEDWRGEDDDRPLDEAGRRQAEALADVLAPFGLSRLISSPARRCVETLEPLARRTGLRVQPDEGLRPDGGPTVLTRLAAGLGDGTVACTHGEVMEALLDRFCTDRLLVEGAASRERLLLKGAAWGIEGDGDGLHLRLHVPVALTACPHHG